MDLAEVYAVTDTATEGVELALGDGAAIGVARWMNERHQAAHKRLMKPYKHFKKLPQDVENEIEARSMAEAIWVWSNDLVVYHGRPVETADMRYKVLMDPAMIAFSQKIKLASLNDDLFFPEDADEKNSKSSPAGGSESDSELNNSEL